MIVSAEGTTLCVTLEDNEEWETVFELNDGSYVDIMLDRNNIDVLFPEWQSYVDRQDILPCLRYEDANRFDGIRLTFGKDVTFRDGEGDYPIKDLDMIPADNEDGDDMLVVTAEDTFTDICLLTYYFN